MNMLLMDTCSICLEEIKSNHITKTLSCNHKFHFCCFKKLVYHNGNFFIDCPLCRNMNHNIDFPIKDDHRRNILLMCNGGVGNLYCSCTNKNGKKCKKNHIYSIMVNVNFIIKKFYQKKNINYSQSTFIIYFVQTTNGFLFYIYLILGKKLLYILM